MIKIGFGKNFSFAMLIYIILNFIFAIIYQAVAGDISGYFGSISSNLSIFLSNLLLPPAHPISEIPAGVSLANDSIVDGIIMLLWMLLPGIIASVVSSWKFADESPKTAFGSSLLGIYIPIVIAFILNKYLDGFTALNFMDTVLYGIDISYIVPGSGTIAIIGLFIEWAMVSAFFAGWGAMSSSSF